MENWVASIKRRNVDCSKAKSTSDCQSVRFGYSSAGKVVRLNLLRPDCMMARSSSKVTVISDSSDSVRQISKNFFAGMVKAPLAVDEESWVRLESSTSRSVPVIVRRLSSICSSTLFNTGIFGRLLNTPHTCCNGFNRFSREILNCIGWLLMLIRYESDSPNLLECCYLFRGIWVLHGRR